VQKIRFSKYFFKKFLQKNKKAHLTALDRLSAFSHWPLAIGFLLSDD